MSCFLQCFDTVRWVTEVCAAHKKPVPLILENYLPEQVEREKKTGGVEGSWLIEVHVESCHWNGGTFDVLVGASRCHRDHI